MDIVNVAGVCKTYPAFRLKDVSFSLERGKITGFIGRNGAGKTTTIKSMLNLIHTDSGEVSYFGIPLSGHETEIKQRIGYSTGTVSWYPRKTIREIVDVTRTFYPNWDGEAYRRYMELFPFSRDELLDLFRTLKEHGVTILFSTHITSDLEKCADNIIYISRGEIRADCPKADFMRDCGKADETLEEVFLRLEREARV